MKVADLQVERGSINRKELTVSSLYTNGYTNVWQWRELKEIALG